MTAELEEALCAKPDPHEAHNYPLQGDNDWMGPPVWHCPGLTEVDIAMDGPDGLPGISAAKFREDLRSTFIVVGMPVFMFGVVLHMWGPVLMMFFAGMLAVMIVLDVIQRARRVQAIERINQGELPEWE